MNPITVLRRSAVVAARILAVASCMMAAGALLDLPGIGAHAAFAKDGADDGADDGSSHDDGSDDHGGGGHGADDDGGGSSDDSGGSGSSGSGCDDRSVSADLNYADGFHEHVSDCTYVLTDQHGRVVITRSATPRDFERLQQISR